MENENEKERLVSNVPEGEPPLNNENENQEEGKKVEIKIDRKGEKEDKKKEEPKLVFMKKGAYTVHILILEIKNVEKKDPDAAGALPIIKMSALGDSKRTGKIEINGDYFYGEHYYFEKSGMQPEQLESEKIVIEVYDFNFPERQDYYGVYETDFQHIYSQPKHALQNFWIALANPESNDFTKIRGYMRLSISVLNDKDDRVELIVEKTDKTGSQLMMPPQIRLKYKQLKIHFLEAQDLPDMDSLLNAFKNKQYNECDAYVSIQFLGVTLNTSVDTMKKNIAKWSETIYIPIIFPVVSHKIKMTVWDKDPGSSEIIGSYEIDVDKVLNNEYKNWQFVHIYGSPLNTIGKFTKKMNKHPEIGSSWKGKIFMKIDYEDDPHIPKTEVRKMEKEIESEGYANIEKSVFWTVNIVLYEALFLPGNDKYKIMIAVEHRSASSMELKKAVDNYINFNKFKASIKAQSSVDDLSNIGDLFIYLVRNGKKICFQRFPCSTFSDKSEVMIVKLIPDFAVGEIKESRKAGILKLEINIKKTNFFTHENDLNSSYNSLNNDIQLADVKLQSQFTLRNNNNYKEYFVIANIYQSRYLISGDNDGTSDPYVKIKLGKQILKTSIKNDTVNPIWNEFLVFENVMFDHNDSNSWPILYAECLDSDFLEFNDDCLGYSYIWLNDTSHYINNLKPKVKPIWQQLYLPLSNRPQGQILMSFFILEKEKFPDKNAFLKEINTAPDTKKYTFEINILGLRDLQPLSLIPVKKPYIIFDVNSINFSSNQLSDSPGKKGNKKEDASVSKQISSIKTQPKESGPNPNINTVLKFDVNLPIDEIFIPQLQCMVNDSMLSGLINQLLGLFMIPIKNIIKEHNDAFEKDFKTLKKNMLKYDKEISEFNAKKLGEYTVKKAIKMIENNDINIEEKKSVEIKINLNNNDHEKANLLAGDIKKEKSIPKTEKSLNRANSKEFVYDSKDEEDEKIPMIKRPKYKKYLLPGVKENSPNFKEYDIEDENDLPSSEWMEVGFNKGKEDNKKFKKHFRKKINCELEKANVYDIKSPFDTFLVKRGKFEDKRQNAQIFEALSNPSNKIFRYVKKNDIMTEEEKKKEEERINELNKSIESQKLLDEKYYGCFKGLIRILDKEKFDSCTKMTNTLTSINQMKIEEYPYLEKFNSLSKQILCPTNVVVRVYVLEVHKIKPKDILSASDPFLILKIGDQIINDIENRQEDKEDMRVYKRYDLNAKLPGPSKLIIELYDYDFLFSNELIGSTIIDIEDRYFDNNWKKLKHKPVEVRSMRDPDLPGEQAQILLWLEIFDKSIRDFVPSWDIAPAPEIEMELRLIIWETKDIPFADIEETSDIYVTVFTDEKIKRSTDVHFRCQTGCGSFNYRILLPVKYPSLKSTLNIQVFDNDLLSHDDFICGTDLDLSIMLRDLYYLNIPMKFDKSYFDDICKMRPELKNIIYFPDSRDKTNFWIKCFRMEGTEKKQIGEVKMSIEIMPKWKADICKVGEGRGEPNINPYLPPPSGRFEWSLNPFKMFNQLVGPGIRNKIYCACCIIFCLLIILVFLPYIGMHLVAELINPLNYRNSTKLLMA